MSRMRALTIAGVLAAGSMLPGMPVSPTSAQPAESVARAGVRLPACDPSMIVGTWQAAFAYGTPIYGTAQNNGFSCPLTVATDGTITSGTCILGSGITVSPVPSGTVTIDRSCHVAGSITFGYCNPGRSCVNHWQMSVSLWRSADGSRLTGTQVLTCPKCKSVQDQAVTWVSPFEMIAGQ